MQMGSGGYFTGHNSGPQPGAAGGMTPPPGAFDLISREELKRLSWDQGLTDAEIARMYHVSTNQVNRKRRQMNLLQGQMTSQQLAEVVRLAERIKTLPLEAIQEIQAIVARYDPDHTRM